MYLLIQVLRGIAALMVVAHHSLAPAAGFALPPDAFPGGAAGVDIFFVISGFIIFVSVERRHLSAGEFLRRRFARIFPPYWVITTIVIALHLAISMNRDMVLSLDHITLSYLLIPHDSPTIPGSAYPLLIPGWTLQYEIFFYALVSLGLLFGPSHWRRVATALAGLALIGLMSQFLLAAGTTPQVFRIYTNPLLLEFLSGCGLGYLVSKRRDLLPLWLIGLVPAGLLYFLVCDEPGAYRIVLWGTAAVVIVAGALAVEVKFARFKPWPLLVLLGDASYSIYLTHTVTLGFLRGAFRSLFPAGQPNIPVLLISGIIVSSIVGVLFYRYIEHPLVRHVTRTLVESRQS